MTTFRYHPIDDETVRSVRETMRDAHGNELRVRISETDSAPCRSCLRVTPLGTPLILFAHRPFTTAGPYAETGPVFVHADACTPYPGSSAFPDDFRSRILVLRAYDAQGDINDATLAAGDDAEAMLTRLFDDAAVVVVHARNPAWGCFDFAITRA
jgi:uncharacterized protein DUF1203